MDIRRAYRFARGVAVVLVSVVLLVGLLRFTEAGSLDPIAVPAGTMHSLGELFGALASSGYDSSAVPASKHGSAIAISKCIILHLQGNSSCP